MRFRFIGRYTNGHTSINACGVVFEGHEPSDVPEEAIERLSRNPEFEAVEPVSVSYTLPVEPAAPAKRRGRPKKAVE